MEIELEPDSRYRVESRDVTQTVPVAPWEAALGATIEVPTPSGGVEVNVPAGSNNGRKLRLKDAEFRAIRPAIVPRARIGIASANNEKARELYQTMAREFASFNPRGQLEHNDDTAKVDAVLIDEETLTCRSWHLPARCRPLGDRAR